MTLELTVRSEDKTSLISYLNEVTRLIQEGYQSGYFDTETNWNLTKLEKVI